MFLIQAKRDTLLKPLQSVIGIVERRHTLPILSNVLIESDGSTLSLTATDLEIQVIAQATLKETQAPFALTVSAKKLIDILRALPEDAAFTLESEATRALLKSGKSRFTLQTLQAEEFPKLAAEDEPGVKLSIPQKTLKHLLNQVQYAMAQQDIRYYLNGLLVVIKQNAITVVATDGHRLSFAKHQLDQAPKAADKDGGEVILPRKSVVELIKLLQDTDDPIQVEIGKKQAKFLFSGITLVSKIVDGKFPDYTRVIPSAHQMKFTLPRLELLQALQRAAILSNEKFRGVRLVVTRNSLSIICNNNEQEEAQVELEIDYDGSALDIGFNVTYLLDVLNNLDESEIECAFADANSSGLLTIPGNEYFKYVVMPMRI